jgi:hypothetical protein
MSRTFLIPARVLLDVREAILSVMGDAAMDLQEPVIRPERERHPEWFVEGRARLEHLWRLLDLISWGEASQEVDVELDQPEYGLTILDAATHHAKRYKTWEEEADATDEWLVEEGEPPRKAETLRRGADLREFISALEPVV